MTALVQTLLRVTSIRLNDDLTTVAIFAGIGLLCSLAALLLGWSPGFF